MSGTNRAVFAGRWYSDDPRQLAADLEGYRSQATEISGGGRPRLFAAVLPHAGLGYSGRGIAHAFTGDVSAGPSGRRVLILSPSHYVPLRSAELLAETFVSHETPLGAVAGDPSFASRLTDATGGMVRIANEVIEGEHGTEMLLPFIRRYLPDATVSLLLVPEITDDERLRRWGDAIRRCVVLEETLLIMSSDFTHYGPRFGYAPFGAHRGRGNAELSDRVVTAVADDDRAVAQSVAGHDRSALRSRMERPITVCGRYPILLGLEMLYGGDLRPGPGEVVDYYTSRDISGSDDPNFVCYASIVFPDRTGMGREG
jgi:AmmeMemoRadiSam system protein B